MKVLLDENLLHDLRKIISGHDIYTAVFMGWGGKRNGVLLRLAAQDGFEALITMDRGIAYQQNAGTLRLAVIALSAPSNDLSDLTPLVPLIIRCLDQALSKKVHRIP